ncbi:MAG: hypothetical protein RBR86_08865 [Pseudobdellovibrionaceae bacterium]|nr:hypothetical protein [Pseudobdellovibrionaceae bacterium]
MSLIVMVCVHGPHMAHASSDAPTPYLQSAINLLNIAHPPYSSSMWPHVLVSTAPHGFIALAQYTPLTSPEGEIIGKIKIGSDFHRYKKEYTVLSSNIPRYERPDFDHYYTIVLALSLVNETAHFIQHQNGSLDDFHTFKTLRDTPALCTLYSLQQHVSDVEMLDAALRLEHYFIQHGAIKSLYALRLALEKMGLREIFSSFRSSYSAKDAPLLRQTLQTLYLARLNDNMQGLNRCNGVTRADLGNDVLDRAVAPARDIFEIYFDTRPAILPRSQNSQFNP